MFVIFSIILVIGGFYFFVAYNSSPPRSAIQTTESFKSEERWNRIMSSVSMIAVILGIASFMASRNQKITID
jgi:preprotein translocase subunit YajC